MKLSSFSFHRPMGGEAGRARAEGAFSWRGSPLSIFHRLKGGEAGRARTQSVHFQWHSSPKTF
jgi:hypothetical protein